MMVMAATPIRRIYEEPAHGHYGPVRRMWIMLEQLFADRGGVRVLEVAIATYQGRVGLNRPGWDAHLAGLMDSGLSEPSASRMVMQQLLIAAEMMP